MKHALVCFLLIAAIDAVHGEEQSSPDTALLEKTVRAFQTEMASDDKDRQIKAIKSIVPTEEDIKALYPQGIQGNGTDKIIAMAKEAESFITEHVVELSKEVTRNGKSISKIEVEDQRKFDLNKPELRAIPKDIPIYSGHIELERGGASFHPMAFVNKHWVQIDLCFTPAARKKLAADSQDNNK
jgi:hypothetical protein